MSLSLAWLSSSSCELSFPDDRQPRANIKKGLSNGNLQTETDIDRFATKLAADPKLVKEYVQHLNDLQTKITDESCSEKKETSVA